MFKRINVLIVIFFLSTVSAFSAGGEQPDGGNEGKASKYDKGHKLVLSGKYWEKKANKFLKKGNSSKAEKNLAKAEKKYEKAFKLFLASDKEKPNNADTLNYLGFTSRKLGNFEEAEKYYLSGLKIKPDHKRINQYLGELYLNTDRKNKAIEQLNILESCNCKEYDQLKEIIDGKRVSKY
ncbi:tetratricopeptide repeat protein [Candidatus Pelagibacter sp.]|nr:tetratricopeptide repeat protein [Candidatus Pelagibacter sp.]